MGSHNSHEKSSGEQGGSGSSTPRGSQRGTRSGSSGELPEKQEAPQTTSMVPVEKLAKLLVQRSQKEDGVNGVTETCFTKYLFPMYPDLARHFFRYLHKTGKCKNKHINLSTFKQQCERIMAMLDDTAIIEAYVRMFSSDSDEGVVTPDGLRSLLYISYKLSMDHYPEGPQTCLMINKTLSAVINGCFNKKDSHSVGFVVRWLGEHCHRLIFPVHSPSLLTIRHVYPFHDAIGSVSISPNVTLPDLGIKGVDSMNTNAPSRYCVHMLATRHRDIEAHVESNGSGAGLELATPVLERGSWHAGSGALLPVSAAWLLAATAPPLYSRPAKPPPAQHAGGGSAAALWLARLVCAVPSHWAPLYASREHGLGANRFLHHTLAYRGPTLVVVASEEMTAVIACPQEWRETHQYWGGPDCALIQLYPTFAVIEHGPKMLYLNTSIRGYPRGLRAGSDPRKPLLSLNDDFDSFTFQGVPYAIQAIEVWGCGDQTSRENQLEVKKWQVREAERQRQVKLSAADWIEHPDRYLLELAGRPQYNNSAS